MIGTLRPVPCDCGRGGVCYGCSRSEARQTQGVLTKEALDKAFADVLKQGSRPRYDCHFDGHALQWNPLGFHFCIYCGASEADVARPS